MKLVTAAQMRDGFNSRLADAGDRLEFTVKAITKTQLRLSGSLNCLIYFKVSSREPFWWGIGENPVRLLNKSGERWFLVLLRGSPRAAYLLTSARVQDRIDNAPLSYSQGKRSYKTYKIHEGRELEGIVLYRSSRRLISALRASLRATASSIDSVAEFGSGLSEADFRRLEARRAEIGRQGEEYVVKMERKRLREAGRKDLAKRVIRVSKEDVGAGYDILSFCPDDEREKYIEVKTSTGQEMGFHITAKEKSVAEERGDDYWLYLVRNIEGDPEVTEISNPGSKFGGQIVLDPVAYKASLRRCE